MKRRVVLRWSLLLPLACLTAACATGRYAEITGLGVSSAERPETEAAFTEIQENEKDRMRKLGMEALDSGDFEQSYRFWRDLAASGDSEGMLVTGLFYEFGMGMSQDIEEALHWFKLAAAHGSAEAAYLLGWKYYYGVGVKGDSDVSLHWFKNMEELKGDNPLKEELSWLRLGPAGYFRNLQVVMEFYLKRAFEGDVDAMLWVASVKQQEHPLHYDPEGAAFWLEKATETTREAGEDLPLHHRQLSGPVRQSRVLDGPK